jgi:hypothetical protein
LIFVQTLIPTFTLPIELECINSSRNVANSTGKGLGGAGGGGPFLPESIIEQEIIEIINNRNTEFLKIIFNDSPP